MLEILSFYRIVRLLKMGYSYQIFDKHHTAISRAIVRNIMSHVSSHLSPDDGSKILVKNLANYILVS